MPDVGDNRFRCMVIIGTRPRAAWAIGLLGLVRHTPADVRATPMGPMGAMGAMGPMGRMGVWSVWPVMKRTG